MDTKITDPSKLRQPPPPAIVKARSKAPLSETCFPRKILLVDDDPAFCLTMRQDAQEHDALLVFCRSLKDLTRLVEIDRFDLVLVRIDMRGGSRIADFIRTFFKDVPIVLLGPPSLVWDEAEHYYGSSVLGYIPRDLTPATILVELSQILLRRYRFAPAGEFSFDHVDYTEFCGRPRLKITERPAARRMMATLGKVLLANASLLVTR